LRQDLAKAIDPDNDDYKFKLGIFYNFNRALPEEAITASGA
jgi:hypothetical protein